MKYCVVSLPFQPRSEVANPFYFSTAVVGEYIAEILDASFYLGINENHSFRTYSKNEVEAFRNMFDWLKHETYTDTEYIDKSRAIVQKLYQDGLVTKKEVQVYCCPCGRIEISEEGMNAEKGKSNLKFTAAGVFCNQCGRRVEKKTINSLMWKLGNEKMSIFPEYYEKDCHHFQRAYADTELRISRNRYTGISVKIGNDSYNLDVDFVWKCIPSLVDEDCILVSSNKHLFELYCINILGKQCHKQIHFICVPYINCTEEEGKELLEESNRNWLRLNVLLCDWSKKTLMLNSNRYSFIKKNQRISESMYSNLRKIRFETSEWNEICSALRNELNFQFQLKEIRKNG